MAQASRRVTIDLVPAQTNIKSTIPDPLAPAHAKRAWPGSFAPASSSSYSQVPTLGLVAEFNNVARGVASPISLPFPQTFANGTAVPLGQYRLLLRALRLTGDPHDERDYDVYVSQPVGLVASH